MTKLNPDRNAATRKAMIMPESGDGSYNYLVSVHVLVSRDLNLACDVAVIISFLIIIASGINRTLLMGPWHRNCRLQLSFVACGSWRCLRALASLAALSPVTKP